MQLNVDCVRDILLTIEQECDGFKEFRIDDDIDLSTFEYLNKYDRKEVMYHIHQCQMSGFFAKCVYDITGGYSIDDLSPSGHEFLQNIRNDSVFNKLKEFFKQGGSLALKSVAQLAFTLATEAAKNQMFN